MVEFQIVENGGARTVMDELGSLVKKRRIVFVGFDHKKFRARASCRHTEIQRNTADDKRWIESGALEDPRQHRRGRRLAVRSGDGEHPEIAQHVFVEPLWARDIRTAGVQNGLHQRIAARDDITDDKDVGIARDPLQLLGPESFGKSDSQRLQLRRHRRVDVRVAPRYAMAGCLRDGCDSAHECAADAKDMQMHVRNDRCQAAALAGARRP